MKQLRAIPPLPSRPRDGHKGSFGHLLIVAGSEGMIGAPALCGLSALRCGCGLAYLAAPRDVLPWVLLQVPELVGIALSKANDPALAGTAARATAFAAGPGMGTGAAALARLRLLLLLGKPGVLDADALTLLAQGKIPARQITSQLVLTPHPGEMARLAKWLRLGDVPSTQAGRLEIAAAAARKLRLVLVLKGHSTVITDGEQCRINETGDTSLAKAGTGDVLTGAIGSLLAQGMPPFQTASLAVHLHGLAGESAGRRLGPRSVLARDVVDALHTALAMYHPAPPPQ